MPYIPEHRFQGDLYSSLGEFIILETNVPYEGYYHKLSSGKYFTGKTPYIEITQELVPIAISTPSSFNNTAPVLTLGGLGFPNRNITENYFRIFGVNKNLTYFIPQPISQSPTTEDYTNGTFIRYILFNTVIKNYLEVDQNTYTNIKSKNPEWDYFNYQAFTLPWRISGTKEEIIQTNTKMIVIVSRDNNLPTLSSYLVDLCEYSTTKQDIEELFTYTITYQNMGGEPSTQNTFNPSTTQPTNLPNDFHVMPDGRIMPGKTHEEYLNTLTSSINTQTLSSTTLPTPDVIPNNTNRGGY